MTHVLALRRYALTLTTTQPNGRIGLIPIPVFPHIAFIRQIENFLRKLYFSSLMKLNTIQL